MQITIYYQLPNSPERAVEFDKVTIIIGRPKGEAVDINLEQDTKVSRPHARLTYALGVWWIEDLNSKHGIFVNNVRIDEKTQVFPTSQIILGSTVFRVEYDTNETDDAAGLLQGIQSGLPAGETTKYGDLSNASLLQIFKALANISAFHDGQRAIDAALDEIRLIFADVERSAIVMLDNNVPIVRAMRSTRNASISFTLVRHVINNRKVVRWEPNVTDSLLGVSKIPSMHQVKAAIYAPIIRANNPIGAIALERLSANSVFSDYDVDLLAAISNLLGGVLGVDDSPSNHQHQVFILADCPKQEFSRRLQTDLLKNSIKAIRAEPGDSNDEIENLIRVSDLMLRVCSAHESPLYSSLTERLVSVALSANRKVFDIVDTPELETSSTENTIPFAIDMVRYDRFLDELISAIRRVPIFGYKQELRPIRLLILSAAPDGSPLLGLAREMREIETKLSSAQIRDRFEIHYAHALRFPDLSPSLLQIEPDIVHFAGYGNEQGAIMLEDDNGAPQAVSAEILSDLFSLMEHPPLCVVLNACWTAVKAEAIAEVVEYVIATQTEISDLAATRFASGFYQGLGLFGLNIGKAFKLGKIEIKNYSPDEKEKVKIVSKKKYQVAI